MAQYLVGLDGGTTGCKTCIFDLDGKLVGSDYREYPSYYPEPGWVEQTTEDLLPNFYDSIKTAINKSGINYESLSKDLKLTIFSRPSSSIWSMPFFCCNIFLSSSFVILAPSCLG